MTHDRPVLLSELKAVLDRVIPVPPGMSRDWSEFDAMFAPAPVLTDPAEKGADWRVDLRDDGGFFIAGPDNQVVVREVGSDKGARDRAVLIVRAVNSHSALLAAAEGALPYIVTQISGDASRAAANLRAAIEAAKGAKP